MGIIRRVAPAPREITRAGRRRCDDEDLGLRQSVDGEVGLDAARSIEPRCVDDASRSYSDIVGANALQHRLGISTLDTDLSEGGEIEQRHARADGAMLGRDVGKEVLAEPGPTCLGLVPAGPRVRQQVPEQAPPAA